MAKIKINELISKKSRTQNRTQKRINKHSFVIIDNMPTLRELIYQQKVV